MRALILTFILSLSLNLFSEELGVQIPQTDLTKEANALTEVSKAESDIKVESKKETEIPVVLEQAKKSPAAESPIVRMAFSLVIVGLMGLASYLFVKRNKKLNLEKGTAPEIKMLTQFHLGPKKSLAIIRVAGESILIGLTEQNISMIKSLSFLDEEIPSDIPMSFNKTLDEVEDFSITGIKDFVSTKLKSMRTIQ